MARCNICGKGPMVGNNVSHAKNRTKRRMNPNLHTKRLLIDGKPQRVLICTRCLRTEQKKAV